MEIPTAPSQRKRVRFSYSDDSDADEAPKVKKPRFPKGKKESDRREFSGGKNLGVVDGEEDDGAILSTDPRVAALERATRRDRISEQLLAEDTAVPGDVAVAEEDYGEEDERIEDGVMLEPFNLKQEREEGYFDADGNYVEYRNEEDTKDAWLESAVVDTRFAQQAILAAQAAEEDEAESGKGMSKHEIADIKRRIANALEPGETVLRALRRLKGMSNGRKMSGDTKVQFDRLTEDAMKLLDDGDYNVYEEKKETFQREVEGYDAIARLTSGVSDGAGPSGSSDMFSDGPDDIIQPGGSSSGMPLPSALNVTRKGSELDIFGGSDDDEPGSGTAHDNPEGSSGEDGGTVPAEDSGYVYDPSSGYYYNSELGYYYDVASGLYCSASTYQWYKFDEDQSTYVEVAN